MQLWLIDSDIGFTDVNWSMVRKIIICLLLIQFWSWWWICRCQVAGNELVIGVTAPAWLCLYKPLLQIYTTLLYVFASTPSSAHSALSAYNHYCCIFFFRLLHLCIFAFYPTFCILIYFLLYMCSAHFIPLCHKVAVFLCQYFSTFLHKMFSTFGVFR